MKIEQILINSIHYYNGMQNTMDIASATTRRSIGLPVLFCLCVWSVFLL